MTVESILQPPSCSLQAMPGWTRTRTSSPAYETLKCRRPWQQAKDDDGGVVMQHMPTVIWQ